MALRSKEYLSKLKKDDTKEYDIAYGEKYRREQGITTTLSPQVIAGNTELNNLLDLIIEEGIEAGASNIEVYGDEAGYGIVQYRIGREMVDYRLLDVDAVNGLGIVARKRSGVNYEVEYKTEIGGGMRHTYLNTKYDLRCAFIPSIQGMTMSIRILHSSTMMTDIANLGLPENVEKAYREALRATQGLILFTGGTGSGKTTTQYTGLNTIMQEDGVAKNIRTVENPVEYTLPGIKQTQVSEDEGETFAKILKSFLRGDPDIILVGEINDAETAQTAIRAATSGHLVMSTLHTNNTVEVTRVMMHYGANYIDLSNALQLVINQVLENKLCKTCRTKRFIVDTEFLWIRDRLGVDESITVLYEQNGYVDGEICSDCEGRGHKGATLIVEMLEANYAYQKAMNKAQDNTFELERLLIKDPDANYYPIGRDVFRHLKEGNIDIQTAQRIMKKQTGQGTKELKEQEG